MVELVFPSCVFQPRPGRRPRGRPGNATQLHTAPRIQSPISQHLEKGRHSKYEHSSFGRIGRRIKANVGNYLEKGFFFLLADFNDFKIGKDCYYYLLFL